jgi:chemotaxis protein MotB
MRFVGATTPPASGRREAPKWLMTFADLMALLFALFVLLLSFSEIDSDSFRRNAGPMAEAFNRPPPVSNDPEAVVPQQSAPSAPQRESSLRSILRNLRTADRRRRVADQLRFALAGEIRDGAVVLREAEDFAIIRFPAAKAFEAGSADLNETAGQTIDRVAAVLAQTKGPITVSGHTDDQPISTARFRSNWDLSTARAASVVHRLLRNAEILPDRISAAGHADTRPIETNDTEPGRAANRRVEIRIEIANEPPPASGAAEELPPSR